MAAITPSGQPGKVRPWIAASLFLAAFLTLYLLTLSNNYSADGMSFVTMTTRWPTNTPLFFQAEHLLYPAAPWLWFQLCSLFGYSEGALRPLQVLNAISGASGVALFFLFLRRILNRGAGAGLLSILGSLALGLSYGYWYHSTEAEDQIISITFIIASLLILARMSQTRGSAITATGLAFTTSLSLLFHATAVLFLPALLLGIWLKGAGRRFITIFLAGLAFLVGLPYLTIGAGALGYRSPVDFLRWAASAPARGVWGHLRTGNLAEAARTATNAVLYSDGFPNLIGSPPQHSPLAPMAPVINAALLGGALFLMCYLIYHWRRFLYEKWILVAIAWLVPVVAFNLYWAPGDIQFWIAAFVAMVIITVFIWADLLGRYPSWRWAWQGLGVVVVVVLFLGNLSGAMVPRHDLATNTGYAKAICLEEKTTTADLIITPGWDWASSYLPYFGHRDVLSLVDTYLLEAHRDRERLHSLVQQRLLEVWGRGGKVFTVRLFTMEGMERGWFIQSVGFDPGGLALKRQAAGNCLGEPLWEIQP